MGQLSASRIRRSRNLSQARTKLAKPIDKSVLKLAEPRRILDRDHVRFVATQPYLICGRQPSDARHLRFTPSRSLRRKVSDEFTVPLCRGHHREIQRHGDETAWWKTARPDPTIAARALWLKTRPLPAVSGEIREISSMISSASRSGG